MRPMWVKEASVQREQKGDGLPTFLLRLENNTQCVEVRLPLAKMVALLEEGQRAVPAELVPAR